MILIHNIPFQITRSLPGNPISLVEVELLTDIWIEQLIWSLPDQEITQDIVDATASTIRITYKEDAVDLEAQRIARVRNCSTEECRKEAAHIVATKRQLGKNLIEMLG